MHTLQLSKGNIERCALKTSFHQLKNLSIRLLEFCPQLNILEIEVNDYKRMSLKTLFNIIKDNGAICNLKICINGRSMEAEQSHFQQFINEHEALVELELNVTFAPDDALWLMRQFNSMKRFCFNIYKFELEEISNLIHQITVPYPLTRRLRYMIVLRRHQSHFFIKVIR